MGYCMKEIDKLILELFEEATALKKKNETCFYNFDKRSLKKSPSTNVKYAI